MPRMDSLEARAQGWDAAAAGLTLEDNPYPSGPGAADAGDWRAGFIDWNGDLVTLWHDHARNREDEAKRVMRELRDEAARIEREANAAAQAPPPA